MKNTKILLLCFALALHVITQAQLFGGQIKVSRRFPASYTVNTNLSTWNHVTNADVRFFFDDLVTLASQTVVAPNVQNNMRFHQEPAPDILHMVFNQIIPVGGRIVVSWSNIQVGAPGIGFGWIGELRNGGTVSQPIINTISNVNIRTNTTEVANGNDLRLTINIVANMNTFILKSSDDGVGADPILLEIEVFDNNGVKIPVN